MKAVTVSLQEIGDYNTIQAAIDALAATGGIIQIKNGIYHEKIHVRTPKISLIGESREGTIITYGDYAKKIYPDGESYGTFRSYTFYVGANDFIAKNITFVNSAGTGDKMGQAIAVYSDSDRAAFYNCSFEGYQDTLFLSPLPPSPIIPGSFIGPGKRDSDLYHRSYLYHCSIKGDIDFIFGGGTAYFEQCDIISNDLCSDINGYISAASTPKGHQWGFVFHCCRLISDCKPNSVYLGRPWRNYAKTAFIFCNMGAHIRKEGWDNWNKTCSETSVTYAEYKNTGKGGSDSERVSWSTQLTKQEAEDYTISKVLYGKDGWNPKISE